MPMTTAASMSMCVPKLPARIQLIDGSDRQGFMIEQREDAGGNGGFGQQKGVDIVLSQDQPAPTGSLRRQHDVAPMAVLPDIWRHNLDPTGWTDQPHLMKHLQRPQHARTRKCLGGGTSAMVRTTKPPGALFQIHDGAGGREQSRRKSPLPRRRGRRGRRSKAVRQNPPS